MRVYSLGSTLTRTHEGPQERIPNLRQNLPKLGSLRPCHLRTMVLKTPHCLSGVVSNLSESYAKQKQSLMQSMPQQDGRPIRRRLVARGHRFSPTKSMKFSAKAWGFIINSPHVFYEKWLIFYGYFGILCQFFLLDLDKTPHFNYSKPYLKKELSKTRTQ